MPITAISREAAWGQGQKHYDQPSAKTKPSREWQTADIAFLKASENFDEQDRKTLIERPAGNQNGYLPERACGHPVIILNRLSAHSTHVLITPVSAYSSQEKHHHCDQLCRSQPFWSEDSHRYQPPWTQESHKWKKPTFFRSFEGCERSSSDFACLRLADGEKMPKPTTSWLYIQSIFVVPVSVITTFTKARHQLRMEPSSLVELIKDMERRAPGHWKTGISDLQRREPALPGMSKPIDPLEQSWRGQQQQGRKNSGSGRRYATPPSSPKSTRAKPTTLPTSTVLPPSSLTWARGLLAALPPSPPLSPPTIPWIVPAPEAAKSTKPVKKSWANVASKTSAVCASMAPRPLATSC